MKKIMAALIAAGLWAGLATTAFAEFDDEDIAEMAKKLREGEGVSRARCVSRLRGLCAAS
ncbi:MAG: hypothetical protein IIA41_06660 [SAR324 cluster bacterium]|nr:hypothetical protein [SAR324 cluster bacterium]